MPMPSRQFGHGYRFGFNGKEQDNEVEGNGNILDLGARVYDSRVGRWLSVDPLQKKYSGQSPFANTNNNPIIFVDPTGKEVYLTFDVSKTKDGKTYIGKEDFETAVNKGLGGQFQAHLTLTDKPNTFVLTIEPTTDENGNIIGGDASKLTTQEASFYEDMGRMAMSGNQTYAKISKNTSVLVDEYVTATLDIGDVAKFGNIDDKLGGCTTQGMIDHFLTEQDAAQSDGFKPLKSNKDVKKEYNTPEKIAQSEKSEHKYHELGKKAEDNVNGNTRLDDKNGVARYKESDGSIMDFKVDPDSKGSVDVQRSKE